MVLPPILLGLGVLLMLEFGNVQFAQAHNECASNAIAFGSQCLRFFTDQLSVKGASAACGQKGGRLATIEHPIDVHNFITNNYGKQYFWTGGSDDAREDSWKWTDGQPLEGHFPWGPNEPNGGRRQNCLRVGGGTGVSFGYDDVECTNTHGYICESETCPDGCGNGQCTGPGECTCSDGYAGQTCNRECPFPWIGNFGIANQCYRVVAEQPGSKWKTWVSARAHCAAMGGDLAQPRDMKALAVHLSENYAGFSWWWLGGADNLNLYNGQWTWLNGTSIGTGWYTNEPNEGGCLMFWHGRGMISDGNLFSKDCGAKITFVCELPTSVI